MTEMSRRLALVLAVVLVVAGAVAPVAAGTSVAAETAADAEPAAVQPQANETTNETAEEPGATLSGAVGGEGASLSGELESDTYHVELERADGPAERRAVLERMVADLERSLADLRERRTVASEPAIHPGQRAYLSAQTAVRERVLDDLSTRGGDLALRLAVRDEAPESLVERFHDVDVAVSSDGVEPPGGIEFGDDLVVDDWPNGTFDGDLEPNETVDGNVTMDDYPSEDDQTLTTDADGDEFDWNATQSD